MDTTSALWLLPDQGDTLPVLMILGAIALCILLPLVLPDEGRNRYKDPDADQ